MKQIGKAPPLQAAIALIRAEVDLVQDMAEQTVARAIRVGHLLIETKPLLGHGNFQEWIEEEFPRLPYRTAARWMQAAERMLAATGIQPHLLCAPMSELLAPDAPAGANAESLEARQMIFDFMRDKTIKDCLAAVVVDGDEPHRITRAANGRKLGGSRGEDRKDWPKYIGIHLKDITAHLKSYKSFTPAQVESVIQKFGVFFSKCPDLLLGELKKQITEELKSR